MKTWILAGLLALPHLVASPGEARTEAQTSRCEELARDETGREWGYQAVTGRTVHASDGVFALVVGPDEGPYETIEATAEHPFLARPGWTPAGELRPGDEIFTSTGGWIRVHGNTWIAREQLVYNLDVDGADTFFVGESGAWVHNSCIARNRANGITLERQVAADGRGLGLDITRFGQGVSTPLGMRFPDLAVRDPTGRITHYVEVKLGNSPYTASQQARDAWISANTGVPTILERRPTL